MSRCRGQGSGKSTVIPEFPISSFRNRDRQTRALDFYRSIPYCMRTAEQPAARRVRSTPRGQAHRSGQRSAALVTACGLKRAALCRLPAPLARGACGPMRPHDGPISHSRLTPYEFTPHAPTPQQPQAPKVPAHPRPCPCRPHHRSPCSSSMSSQHAHRVLALPPLLTVTHQRTAPHWPMRTNRNTHTVHGARHTTPDPRPPTPDHPIKV